MLEWQLYKNHFCSEQMSEIWSERATLSNWLLVEQALAQALAKVGQIPQVSANKIAEIAVDDLDVSNLQADMNNVGRPILGLTKQLKKLVGEEHQAFVHFGSTTQDIMDTAQMLQIKQSLQLIEQHILNITKSLNAFIQDTQNVDAAGRTNGQFAQSIKLAQKFISWSDELKRRHLLINQAAEKNLIVQIAGPVGNLASYGNCGDEVKQLVAEQLGLLVQRAHWQNARDGLAEIVTSIGLLCGTIHKISHNINLLSSSDIAEFRESIAPGKGASTSMAHKRNQRYSEFAEAVANLGKLQAEKVNQVTLHEYERSGGSWIAEWFVVPQAFLLCSGALLWTEKLFASLVIDFEQIASNLSEHLRKIEKT